MKKLLSILLVSVFLLSLVACSSDGGKIPVCGETAEGTPSGPDPSGGGHQLRDFQRSESASGMAGCSWPLRRPALGDRRNGLLPAQLRRRDSAEPYRRNAFDEASGRPNS